ATYLNMVHMVQYDGTDVNDLTSGEIEGRRQALLAIKALRHFAPGFEAATLRNFGMTIGIRDTRKIVGRYCLTEQDVRSQARFDDAIGIFPEFIDGYGVLVLPTTGRYYHVPYGALVPRPLRPAAPVGRRQSPGRRTLRRRRSNFARLSSQHDVLYGHGTGRRSGCGGLGQERSRHHRSAHRRRSARAQATRRAVGL